MSSAATAARNYVEQLKDKTYDPPRGYRISYYLVLSKVASKGLQRVAEKNDVTLVGLDDLF